MATSNNAALFDFLLRLGDDQLVLGQRLAEWCGHGPILEEDIALANISLDLFGHAQAVLNLAGEMEGQGRDADKLAYFREAIEFKNCLLVEQPRGDFAYTIARQIVFSLRAYLLWDELTKSSNETLAGIAGKAKKESRYHVTHASEWVLRLGDGTADSHARLQNALDEVWRFTKDLFATDAIEQQLADQKIIPNLGGLYGKWLTMLQELITKATLRMPDPGMFMQLGGRTGKHTEHLGHMLSELQILPRSYPDARW
ncbi:MAG: phenylacetate-CoA oxygenase subunit PaaC [Oligoflexia bacterium]|nr:phenylacetate-CoA oxygenase subunit PaaC [Oligoflexia bacterium]